MKKQLHHFLQSALFGILFLTSLVHVQGQTGTPQFFSNVGTGGNAFPLSITAASPHTQFVYAAGEFTGATPGNITTIYVMPTAAVTSMTYNNFSVKMVQVPALTVFSSGTFLTGLTTCLSATSKTFTTVAALGWMKITLTTPFYYDPTKALVIDIQHSAAGSGSAVSGAGGNGTGGNKRIYGAYGSTTGTAGTSYMNMGIDVASASPNDAGVVSIDAPGLFCSAGTFPVSATIRNFGINQITGLNVNWSVNGVTQTPIAYTSLLDTFGTVANTASISLGTYTFPSTTVPIKVWTSLPNAVADTMTKNDSAFSNAHPSLSGTYTVGASGANYTTLTAIANDLNAFGVCGPVDIIVNPGTYTGKSHFNNIAGVNATNRITITGTNKNTCILNDSLLDPILAGINTSYLRISNLTVINRASATCSGISISGNSGNKGTGSSVTNCIVNLPNATSTATTGAIFVSGGLTSGSNQTMDSITIDSNSTNGGYYGIMVYGNTGASSANNRGYLIRNNTIINAYTYGFYSYYIFNPIVVKYNSISMNTGNITTSYGFFLSYNQNSNTSISTEVIGNKVVNAAYHGYYIYYGTSTATAPTKIYNNALLGNMAYSTNYACYLYTAAAGGGNYDFMHNTFHYNGSAATQYGLYYYNINNVNGLNCKNNIFSIYSTAGTTVYPAYFSSNPTINSINYNIYSNTKTTSLGFRVAAFTLANYNTATTGGDSSFTRFPPFTSSLDVHLTDGCTRGVNALAAVPTDYEGNPRSASPNPGMYEFSTFANDLTVDVLYSPAMPITPGAQNLICRVKNSGNNAITSFNISFKLNGGTPVTIPWSGTLAACDTALISFTGSNQITLVSGANNIKVYTDYPNASTDGNLSNDTLRTSLFYAAPMSGNYTIGGTGANFPTFADATTALSIAGVSGPVNFTVNPGTYTVPVVLNGPVYGTSATNTITFDGVNAATRSIVINNASPVFMVNQVSYVTIKNLTLTNNIAGTGTGIALIGGTLNNVGIGFTVKKCVVSLPNTGTSTSYGIIVTGTASGMADGNQWTDSVTIDSNTVVGAYYGIQISTSGTLNAAYNRGHKIRWNTLTNTYYYGIRFYYIANPVDIIGNTINMLTSNVSSYGIYLYYNQHASAVNPTRLIGNKINAGYVDVYYYYWTSGVLPTEMYNNMFSTYGSSYALYLYTAAAGIDALNFYHNSVTTNGAATYGLYYYNSVATGVSYFKNNIFNATGSATYPAYFSTNPAGNVINYNIFYNAGGGNLGFRGAAFTSATYKTATTGGDSSYNASPLFISSTDLHVSNACTKGVDLTSLVSKDFDNTTRVVPPVVGAHEAAGLANDLAIDAVSYPTPIASGSNDLTVRVRNQSGNTCTSFNLKYSINGGTVVTYPWTGTLNGCDTVSVTINGSYALTLANGYNSILLYSSNPNATIDNNMSNDTLRFVLSTVTYVPGNAYSGIGAAKYVKVSHNPKLNIGTNMTVEAWVYLTDPSTRNQKLYSKTKLPTTGNGYILGIENGQLHPEYWDNAGVKTTHTSTATVAANTWTHVAVTWESGVALKSYINGQLVASSPLTSTNPIGFNGSELALGIASWDFGSFPVNGMVDEFRMWNTTLDSSTLRKNMHRMVPPSTPGLVAYYQFNEPFAVTQIGDGVNGLVGNVIGSPVLAASNLPAGGDSCYILNNVYGSSYAMKTMGVSIIDPFDNAVDLVLNEVPLAPNSLPSGAANVLTSRYYIVNPFGNPGTFTANLNFALPPFQISSTDTAMRLYNRSAYSNGAWTLLQTVGASNISGGAVSFNGISTLGQFTLASNGSSPLPVSLLSFGGNRTNSNVLLNWITANEVNCRGFAIERGVGSLNFEEVAYVASKGSNSNKKLSYAFNDQNVPSQELFYRLKQIDLDGKYSYSPIVSIKGIQSETSTIVYPNPFSGRIWVETNANEMVQVNIFDVQGRKIWTKEIFSTGKIEIPASQDWETGIYFIQLNDKQPVKVLKQ